MRIVITLCFLATALTVFGCADAKKVPDGGNIPPEEALVSSIIHSADTIDEKVGNIAGLVKDHKANKTAVGKALGKEFKNMMKEKVKKVKCNNKGGLRFKEDGSSQGLGEDPLIGVVLIAKAFLDNAGTLGAIVEDFVGHTAVGKALGPKIREMNKKFKEEKCNAEEVLEVEEVDISPVEGYAVVLDNNGNHL